MIRLDKNPLGNIRNASTTNQVMNNAPLYSANTLDEVYLGNKKAEKFWSQEATLQGLPELRKKLMLSRLGEILATLAGVLLCLKQRKGLHLSIQTWSILAD